MCSLYMTHWVGREQSLLCCGNRLVLLRQRNKDGDPFMEVRCRRPEKNEGKKKFKKKVQKKRNLRSLFLSENEMPRVRHGTDVWFLLAEFRPQWDLILAVMSKLFVLSRQWPGLTQKVHTPCPERDCPHFFTWRDWQELRDANLYNL